MKSIFIGLSMLIALFAGLLFMANKQEEDYIKEQAAQTEQASESSVVIESISVDTKGVNYPSPEKLDSEDLQKMSETKISDPKPADPELNVDENPIATIKVKDFGTLKFELFPNDAPQSVYNFIELSNSGYYDGLTLHRIVPGFVAQGGDPTGTGTGGPGYSIKGEFPSNGVENPNKHKKGALAMARSQDPNSAGSQFYISDVDMTKDESKAYMDEDYAVFGQLIEGEEILDKIMEEG